MKNSWIRSGAAALIMLALAATAGCAKNGAGVSSITVPDSSEVKLLVWDSKQAAVYEHLAAEYQASHRGVEIDVEQASGADYFSKLDSSLAQGSAADIFMIDGDHAHKLVADGQLAPLDTVIDQNARQAIYPAAVEQYTKDDALWALPQVSDGTAALFYNKDMLEKAGVDAQSLGSATWGAGLAGDTETAEGSVAADSFFEKIVQLNTAVNQANADDSAAESTGSGYALTADRDRQLMPLIGSNGGSYRDDSGDFAATDMQALEAYNYLLQMLESKAADASALNKLASRAGVQQATGVAAFLDAKAGVYQGNASDLAVINSRAKFSWGVAPIPSGKSGRVSPAPSLALGLNSASADSVAAKEFLNWLAAERQNRAFGVAGVGLPVVTPAQKSFTDFWQRSDKDASFFLPGSEHMQVMPAATGAKYAPVSTAVEALIFKYLRGEYMADEQAQADSESRFVADVQAALDAGAAQ